MIGYPIAYWISRYGGQRKILLLILVMLPFWTSYLIRTYAWMIILRDNGVLNGILQATGLIDEPLILLNTDVSVILGMTYGFLPFAILPLFVSIDRLDQNLVQAARDLYASGRGAFLHVTLPLTMPGVIAASLLTFIPAMIRSVLNVQTQFAKALLINWDELAAAQEARLRRSSSRRCSPAAATGRTAPRWASC